MLDQPIEFRFHSDHVLTHPLDMFRRHPRLSADYSGEEHEDNYHDDDPRDEWNDKICKIDSRRLSLGEQ